MSKVTKIENLKSFVRDGNIFATDSDCLIIEASNRDALSLELSLSVFRRGACGVMKMDSVTRVQILNETECISHNVNTLGKGMNATILPTEN